MVMISRVRIKTPKIEEVPEGLIENYINTEIKRVYRMRWQIKENMPDTKTVVEKIFKPSLEAQKGMFKKSIAVAPPEMERWAERYLRTLTELPDIKELSARFKVKGKFYAQKMMEYVLPFKGYKDQVNGLGPLTARWLSGDETVKEEIDYHEDNFGDPIDIRRKEERGKKREESAGQAGRFKQKLINRIAWGGKLITELNYDQRTMNQVNVSLNSLINEFAKGEYDCEINFMYDEGRLYLDIQVHEKETEENTEAEHGEKL